MSSDLKGKVNSETGAQIWKRISSTRVANRSKPSANIYYFLEGTISLVSPYSVWNVSSTKSLWYGTLAQFKADWGIPSDATIYVPRYANIQTGYGQTGGGDSDVYPIYTSVFQGYSALPSTSVKFYAEPSVLIHFISTP